MKKLLISLTLIFLSPLVFAVGHPPGSANAASVSGTFAGTNATGGAISTGNGSAFAIQGSSVSSVNATGAGANSQNYNGIHGVTVESHVESIGTTTSVSFGAQGATGTAVSGGNTEGLGLQGGIGAAESTGGVFSKHTDGFHTGTGVGIAATNAFAAQGSIAATSNVNNGGAISISGGAAFSNNDADISVSATPHDVDFVQNSNSTSVAGGFAATAFVGNGLAGGAGGGISNGAAGTLGFGIVTP